MMQTLKMINNGSGAQIGNLNGNLYTSNVTVCLDKEYKQVVSEVIKNLITNFGEAMIKSMIEKVGTYNNILSGINSVEWERLDHKHFCLFVLENAIYDSGTFSIAKTKALKYTPDREYYRRLTVELIEEIIQMPCIFATRNNEYGRADPDTDVVVGCVTDVVKQEGTIAFKFNAYQHFPQQIINDNIRRFNLLGKNLRTQLDEEHWSIRNGDLIEAIKNLIKQGDLR